MADDVTTEPLRLTIIPHDTFDVDGEHFDAGVTADVPRLVAERLLLQGKAVPASAEAHGVFVELGELAGGQISPLVQEMDMPATAKAAAALGKKHANGAPAEDEPAAEEDDA